MHSKTIEALLYSCKEHSMVFNFIKPVFPLLQFLSTAVVSRRTVFIVLIIKMAGNAMAGLYFLPYRLHILAYIHCHRAPCPEHAP